MAALSLAETRARSRLGMAMAAMMPMIATTMSSSIRVKPVTPNGSCPSPVLSNWALAEASVTEEGSGGCEHPPEPRPGGEPAAPRREVNYWMTSQVPAVITRAPVPVVSTASRLAAATEPSGLKHSRPEASPPKLRTPVWPTFSGEPP